MSHNCQRHIKKKVKKDVEFSHSSTSNRIMNPPTLEPRRDLPLNKIPELLAKITGTFSSTLSSSSLDTKTSSSHLSLDRNEQLFEHYSSSHSIMSVNEILRFCTDLSLEPDSYEVLLFCFLCRAKQMYTLTKEEFLHGVKTLVNNHWENLHDLRTALFHYDITPFHEEFYRWIYHYGLIDGQRCLTTSNAICLWRLFYSKRIEQPRILNQWLNYLENNDEVPKSITYDTWTIFPQFARFIQSNGYASYDDNEAWPCLFDGFVEHQQKTM